MQTHTVLWHTFLFDAEEAILLREDERTERSIHDRWRINDVPSGV